jgi:hypothetical protein
MLIPFSEFCTRNRLAQLTYLDAPETLRHWESESTNRLEWRRCQPRQDCFLRRVHRCPVQNVWSVSLLTRVSVQIHRAIGRFEEALVDVLFGSEYNTLLQLLAVVVSPTRESDLRKYNRQEYGTYQQALQARQRGNDGHS